MGPYPGALFCFMLVGLAPKEYADLQRWYQSFLGAVVQARRSWPGDSHLFFLGSRTEISG